MRSSETRALSSGQPPGLGTLPTLLLVVLTVAAGATLYTLPPTLHSFYPRCPIQALLHLQCPGCGTTRAVAALLHGHLGEALQRNALTTLTLPTAAIYLSLTRLKPRLLHPPSPAAIYLALSVTAVFTVARNL